MRLYIADAKIKINCQNCQITSEEFDGVFDIAHLRCACGGRFRLRSGRITSPANSFLSDKHLRPGRVPGACAKSSACSGGVKAVPPACLDLDEVEVPFLAATCPARNVLAASCGGAGGVNPWSSHRAAVSSPSRPVHAVSWSSVRRRKLSCFFEIFFMTSSEMNRSRRLS